MFISNNKFDIVKPIIKDFSLDIKLNKPRRITSILSVKIKINLIKLNGYPMLTYKTKIGISLVNILKFNV